VRTAVRAKGGLLPMTLTLQEIRRLQRLRAMLEAMAQEFGLARFREDLWVEMDRWNAAQGAAAWAPYLQCKPPNPPDHA
jgi:hypothetical protein